MIRVRETGIPVRTVPRMIGDAAGRRPGPTLVIVGGLHGNEPAGVLAAERVHHAITTGRASLDAGRLVSLRGNVAALSCTGEASARPRYIHEDLNRVFDGSADAADGRASVERRERDAIANELERITVGATGPLYLLDLHTVSSDSPAFVAFEDSLPARRFASCFPLPKILGMEEELAGLLIDYATTRHGFVACIAEAGRHDDPRAADVHEAIILLALEELGMRSGRARTTGGESPSAVVAGASGGRGGRFYDVRERIAIRHESFRMQPGAAAFTPVAARRTVVAVERSRPLTVETSGRLFLPNRQANPRLGDDAFFVVKPVGRCWLALSAWLRRREWVHRGVPALLPGVRTRPNEAGTILVAPEYAAVLRRELLHLLGYRLVRWSHAPYLPPLHRLAVGLSGCALSLFGIARRAFSGGEQAALPEERPTDWVARRRRLDVLTTPTPREERTR